MKKRINIVFLYILIVFSAFSFTCCKGKTDITLNHNSKYSSLDLLVHYIDVGQGDSILIQINNKNLLIDGGPQKSNSKVLNYLATQGVKKIDYIIATHPHEDHIGGLGSVIRRFPIGEFWAPKKTSSTNIFNNMIKELQSKKLKINGAKGGLNLDLGNDVSCSILSPISTNYEEINNYSVVLKLTYGSTKLLFMGDAQRLVESELINNSYDLQADIIKIGHHGSNTSSSSYFLDKVSPKYAIISCGTGNDYNHPNKDTLEELKKRNITTYRTDQEKDIVFLSDGKSITKK